MTLHTKALEAAMEAHMIDNNFEKELRAYFASLFGSPEFAEKLANTMNLHPERGNLDCAKAVIETIKKECGYV